MSSILTRRTFLSIESISKESLLKNYLEIDCFGPFFGAASRLLPLTRLQDVGQEDGADAPLAWGNHFLGPGEGLLFG